MNKELRYYNNIELREISGDTSERVIEGYAFLFDNYSRVLYDFKTGKYFFEIIDREAINEDIINNSDVKALYNHISDKILARKRQGQEGTLRLSIDDKGLFYSFSVPNTSLGNDLYENIRLGNINQSSFAFSVENDLWEQEKMDGLFVRRIKKFKELFDVSPVIDPAYSETSVNIREIEQLNEKNIEKNIEKNTYQRDIDMLNVEYQILNI